MVTVESLVAAAAEHAEARRWAHADALLLHVAQFARTPEVDAYRAVLSAMELLHGAGRTSNLEDMIAIADEIRIRLVYLLAHGPDEPS